MFRLNAKFVVGDGNRISFWKDVKGGGGGGEGMRLCA